MSWGEGGGGGEFIDSPWTRYIKGMSSYVDFIDIDKFSIHDLNVMVYELGYVTCKTK